MPAPFISSFFKGTCMRCFYSCSTIEACAFSHMHKLQGSQKEGGQFLNSNIKKFGKRLIFGWLQPVGFPVGASFRLHHVKSVGMPGHVGCVLGTSVHYLKHGWETKLKKVLSFFQI